MTIRIGISGWTYAPWRGVFYPKGLRQKDELAFAAPHFPTIEINGTFYGLQRLEAFASWVASVPDDFVFSVKGPRFITHLRRLREPEEPLANFFASGVLKLGPKLGPFLWQLPPTFRFDPDRIDQFLSCLPHNTDGLAALARRHGPPVSGRAWTEVEANAPVRHALEIRHDSFRTQEFVAILRRRKVALVCADTTAWPRLGDVSADFVYCRLHGSELLYASGYGKDAIARWAARVRRWAAGGTPDDLDRLASKAPRRARDVYVYFDNDMKVLAPRDAHSLTDAVKDERA